MYIYFILDQHLQELTDARTMDRGIDHGTDHGMELLVGSSTTSSPPSYEVVVREPPNELPPPSYAEVVALLHKTLGNGKSSKKLFKQNIQFFIPQSYDKVIKCLIIFASDAKSSHGTISDGNVVAENIRQKP